MSSMEAVIDRVDWCREIYIEDPTSYVTIDFMKFLYEDGEWQELFEVSQNFLNFYPKSVIARAYYGITAWKLGKIETARTAFLKVHNDLHFLADVYTALATIESESGNKDIANYFRKVAEAIGSAKPTIALVEQTIPSDEKLPSEDLDFVVSKKSVSKPVVAIFCEEGIRIVEKKLSELSVASAKGTSIFDVHTKSLLRQYFLRMIKS